MNKILLLFAAAFMLATEAQAQVSYGVKAGLTLPKIAFSGTEEIGVPSTSAAANFYLTGYADIPIAPSVAFQPGLSLQGKGVKLDMGALGHEKINLLYLEIPVNMVYYINAGSGKAFIGAGPYAAIGLSGRDKLLGEKQDVEWGDDGLKRFDAGINTMLGYKMANGFLINVGYSLGLSDLSKDPDGAAKNRVLSFGIGYQF
ncbi:MAG: PorT family protein [Sphingobacterium sp.]|jgi:hypothetical protein|nr:PorT family protein [Sphingobacterium sp.]